MNADRSFVSSLLSAIFTVGILSSISAAQSVPADFVDPFLGTAHGGQTFPAAGVPFAMTQWTPATRDGEGKGRVPYTFEDTRFYGFRGSHFLSGSETQDFGSVQIMMGEGDPNLAMGVPTAALSHAQERATPYTYTVTLPDSGIKGSVTGTERSGFLSLQFPHGGKSWVAVENFARPGDGEVTIESGRREIASRSAVRRIYADKGQLAGFSGYAVLQFDHQFAPGESWSGRKLNADGVREQVTETSTGTCIFFNLRPGEVVRIRIGTSYTSLDEARKNLRAEIPGWSFTRVKQRAEAAWNRELGRIQVSGSLADKRIFYTALYHAMLAPSIFSDVSGTYPKFGGGGFIENTHGRLYYDGFSLWDTYRALHPLFTIIDPSRESDFVQSLIDKGEEGGFLPNYPAWNSYTAEMDGDHGVAVIGDAWIKGIRGFDIVKAYELMHKNAFQSPDTPQEYADGEGRRALQSYLKYGYIPLEDHINEAPHKNEQVSRTLDYAYDDYILSLVAKYLGKKEDASILSQRALNYRNVIDPETGFARGRYADGSWISPFDPAKRVSFVTEGLPFQFTFFVLQDIPGLIQLEHGNAAFVEKLDELFARHLYNQGNEPSHHIAYLYDYAGLPSKTQENIHDIVTTLYSDRPDGLPGNDDAGQMSAWYVFSALGFYPVTPGVPSYAIGTPQFRDAVILLLNGKRFEIVAHNLSPQNFYIRSATLNGAPLIRFWLNHAQIVGGGKLVFEMSNQPSDNWPALTQSSEMLEK